jgi:hypothetical protein
MGKKGSERQILYFRYLAHISASAPLEQPGLVAGKSKSDLFDITVACACAAIENPSLVPSL